MRTAALVLTAVLLTACAPKDDAASDTATPAATAAAPTVADFAGRWQLTTILGNDTVPSTMEGTADPASWTLTFANRPAAVPLTVSVVGDSMVAQSAEYESVLRAGTMVSVRTAGVMNAGALSGAVTATYRTAGAEQVVNGTFTGTKMP